MSSEICLRLIFKLKKCLGSIFILKNYFFSDSFVRLPGGGSIQNSNMHFNLAPNIGVRVNVQRAQIPVRPGMQMPRMPFMPMPGQGPPNAAFHIRIPRPGAPNPRPAPPNVNPQTGHLPNPSFMEFARSANLGGQRGQQNAGSGGQSDQNQSGYMIFY